MIQPAFSFGYKGLTEGIGVSRAHPDHEYVMYLGRPDAPNRPFVPISEENPPEIVGGMVMEGRLADIEPDKAQGRVGKMIVSAEEVSYQGIALVYFSAWARGSYGRRLARVSVNNAGPLDVRLPFHETLDSDETRFSHDEALHELHPGDVISIPRDPDMVFAKKRHQPRSLVNSGGMLVDISTARLHRITTRARTARKDMTRILNRLEQGIQPPEGISLKKLQIAIENDQTLRSTTVRPKP